MAPLKGASSFSCVKIFCTSLFIPREVQVCVCVCYGYFCCSLMAGLQSRGNSTFFHLHHLGYIMSYTDQPLTFQQALMRQEAMQAAERSDTRHTHPHHPHLPCRYIIKPKLTVCPSISLVLFLKETKNLPLKLSLFQTVL